MHGNSERIIDRVTDGLQDPILATMSKRPPAIVNPVKLHRATNSTAADIANAKKKKTQDQRKTKKTAKRLVTSRISEYDQLTGRALQVPLSQDG